MIQPWEEHEERAFVRHLESKGDNGFTPYREMNRWRRRFWGLVAVDAMALLLLWILGRAT
jgi:hypothetical protein